MSNECQSKSSEGEVHVYTTAMKAIQQNTHNGDLYTCKNVEKHTNNMRTMYQIGLSSMLEVAIFHTIDTSTTHIQYTMQEHVNRIIINTPLRITWITRTSSKVKMPACITQLKGN